MGFSHTGRHSATAGNWWQRRSKKSKVGIIVGGLMALSLVAWAAINLINGFQGTVDPSVDAMYQIDLLSADLTGGDCAAVGSGATSTVNTSLDRWEFSWNPAIGTFNDVPPAVGDLPDCTVQFTFQNNSQTEFMLRVGPNNPALPSGLTKVSQVPDNNGAPGSHINPGAQLVVTTTFRVSNASGNPITFDPAIHGIKWCDNGGGSSLACLP